MNKGIFICFTGIDGSGKTTLAKHILTRLNQNGFETTYVHSRYMPLLTKPLIFIGQKLFMKNEDLYRDYRNYSDKKKIAIANHPNLTKIYKYLLFLDYYIQIFYKVNINIYLGKNIVCDRYIYDTIITDLAVDFKYTEDQIRNIIYRLNSFILRPDILYLIDIDEDIAFQRKNDIPSIHYLEDRRKLYLILTHLPQTSILDGSSDPDDLMNHVYSEINTRLKSK
jgi:thymidylate kinase